MRRKFAIFRSLLAAAVLLSLLSSCSLSATTDMKGRSYDVDGITVLDLRGTWYQMGRQYGILAGEQLNDVLAYLDLKLGGEPERMDAAAVLADSLYAGNPDYLKDFFAGVSRTSGLSLERLKLCNAVEYAEGLFLCSALAAWGDYGTGKLVFGRNYDAVSYNEIDKDLVVTVFHPKKGIAAAIVGYAGELYCVNGLNDKGIFVELNNGKPSAGAKMRWDISPTTASLFNMLFEAESLDDVDSFFKSTPGSFASIIGVADRNEARSYEWCCDGVRRGDVMTEDGLMISTNHYVNDGWPFPVPTDETSWKSISRRCNLNCRAEENKGCIDVEKMKEILGTSIDDGGPMYFPATRYQIVAVPEDMILYLCVPSIGASWAELKMSEYFD